MSFSSADIKDYYKKVVGYLDADQFKEAEIICKAMLDYLPHNDKNMRPKFLNCFAKVASSSDSAMKAIEEAISLRPDDIEYLMTLVEICSSREQLERAKQFMQKALDTLGYIIPLANLMARLELMLGNIGQAEQVFAKTEQTPEIRKERVGLKYQMGDLYGADDLYKQYLNNEAPKTAQDAYMGAVLSTDLLEFDRSEQLLRHALEFEPDHPDYLALGIRIANWRGDQVRLKELIDRSYKAEPNHPILLSLIITHDYDINSKTISNAESVLESLSENSIYKTRMMFALARYYDQLSDHERAWNMLVRANKQSADQDPRQFQRLRREAVQARGTHHLKAARGLAEGIKSKDHHEVSFVYLVGAPRTGSSLIQSVLTTDNTVGSLSERGSLMPWIERYVQSEDKNAFQKIVKELALADVAGVRRQGRTESILVDKSTITLYFLGLIARIHPSARFINVTRDPRDIALSIFFHEFPHTSGAFGYTTNMISIADELAHREKVVNGWIEDGFEVNSVRYEAFVSNPHDEGKQLADYIGIDWSDEYLDTNKRNFIVPTFSAKQVRKPISPDAIGKWKSYKNFIDSEALDLLSNQAIL